MSYFLATPLGLVIVLCLGAIAWALGRLRARNRRVNRESLRPKCKHGAHIFGLAADRCEKCRKETEVYFEGSGDVVGRVPWPKRPEIINELFGVEKEIRFEPVERKFKDQEPPPEFEGDFLERKFYRLRDCNYWNCSKCSYSVSDHTVDSHTKADRWRAFEHECKPVDLTKGEVKYQSTGKFPEMQEPPLPVNPLCRQCNEKGSLCWYCRGARGMSRYGDITVKMKTAEIVKGIEEVGRKCEELERRHFRAGQWVRGKAAYELIQLDKPEMCGFSLAWRDTKGFCIHEDNLIPAIPRDGEFWTTKVCEKALMGQSGFMHHRIVRTHDKWATAYNDIALKEFVECGCLVPVNFGNGNG